MNPGDFLRRLFKRPAPAPRATAGAANDSASRWRKALSDLGYPYTLITADIIREKASETFKAEQELGAQQGFTPVWLIPGLWVSSAMHPDERTRRARKLIAEEKNAPSGREFFARAFDQMQEDSEQDPECGDPALFDQLQPVESPVLTGGGLFMLRQYNVSTHSWEPIEQAAIMRMPAASPAEIPIYLDWGSWNAVPSPMEITAAAAIGARSMAQGSSPWGPASLNSPWSGSLRTTRRRSPY